MLTSLLREQTTKQTKQTKRTKCIIHKKIVTIILINVLKQPEFYVLNYFVCYTKDL
ncbi:434L [Invertebrate iridescent virus Kaz2018]|nr:434L [Invertebrate iridescent virus Kaz2018]